MNESNFAENIKLIKSLQKKPDGIFGSFMTRPVSHIIAYLSYKLHLSANALSFISFLFCMAGSIVLLLGSGYNYLILSVILWWFGAILDASDGDLARFTDTVNPFGGWLDSILDRIKEFLIFSVFAYIAWKRYDNDLYLLLGLISIFTNFISGYISDTKRVFLNGKRKPEIRINGKYMFGMVDTRDFIVIVSLLLDNVLIALYIYSTLFLLLIIGQMFKFIIEYGRYKKEKS